MVRKKKQQSDDVSRETYPQYQSYKNSVLGSYCFAEGLCVPVIAFIDEHKTECYIFYNNTPVLASQKDVFRWFDQRAASLEQQKKEQNSKLTVIEKPGLYVPGSAKRVIN